MVEINEEIWYNYYKGWINNILNFMLYYESLECKVGEH